MSISFFNQAFHSDINDWWGPYGTYYRQEDAEEAAKELLLQTEDIFGNPVSITAARVLCLETTPRFTPKGKRRLKVSEKIIKTFRA